MGLRVERRSVHHWIPWTSHHRMSPWVRIRSREQIHPRIRVTWICHGWPTWSLATGAVSQGAESSYRSSWSQQHWWNNRGPSVRLTTRNTTPVTIIRSIQRLKGPPVQQREWQEVPFSVECSRGTFVVGSVGERFLVSIPSDTRTQDTRHMGTNLSFPPPQQQLHYLLCIVVSL